MCVRRQFRLLGSSLLGLWAEGLHSFKNGSITYHPRGDRNRMPLGSKWQELGVLCVMQAFSLRQAQNFSISAEDTSVHPGNNTLVKKLKGKAATSSQESKRDNSLRRTHPTINNGLSPRGLQNILAVLAIGNWGPKKRAEALDKLNVSPDPCTVDEVLSRLTDIKTVFDFFHWAKEQKGYKRSSSTYLCLLRKLVGAKDVERLELVTKEVRRSQRIGKTLCTLLHECFYEVKPLEAMEIFRLVNDLQYQPRRSDYNYLIRVLTQGGYSHTAYRMFRHMSKVDCSPDSYTFYCLIHGFLKSKRVGVATYLLEAMNRRGFYPTVMTYNFVIDSLGKAGKLEAAIKIFQKMKQEGSKVAPNLLTYNSLLNTLCIEGKGTEACQLYKEMKEAGCVPSLETYRCLIGGLCRNGDIQEAREVYRAMTSQEVRLEEGDISVDDNIRQVVAPDAFIYSCIIEALRRAGDLIGALEFLKIMNDKGYVGNVSIYNPLIKSLGKAGRPSETYSLLDQMARIGVKPNAITYSSLIEGLIDAGCMDNALEVFMEMKVRGFAPTVVLYNSLIARLQRRRDWRLAIELYHKMEKDGCIPDHATYVSLMSVMGKAGRIHESYKLLKDMDERGLTPDTTLYNILITDLCALPGHVEDALRLLERMHKRGLSSDPHVQNAIMQAYIRGARWEEAFIVLDLMKTNKCPVEQITYTSLIRLLAKMGEFDKASDVFTEMTEIGYVPDITTYNLHLRCLGRTGKITEAVRIIKELKGRKETLNEVTYSCLLSELWRADNLDAACVFYKEMMELGLTHDPLKFDDFIESLSYSGKIEEACELFELTKERGLKLCVSSYNALIRGLATADKITDACNLFEDMKETGIQGDAATYALLINSLGRIGQLDAASELFDEMNERGLRPNPYSYKGLVKNLVHWGVYK